MALTTARVLSIALLLLTCAPLTSIYCVLVSNGLFPSSFLYDLSSPRLPHKMAIAKNHERTASPTASSPLAAEASIKASKSLPPKAFEKILQDPNSTLEELWVALLRDTGLIVSGGSIMMGPAGLPAMQAQHWTIILPWGISLLLGVVIPCILSLRDYWQGASDDDDDPWVVSRLRKQKKRLSRLVRALKDHRKILEESDVDLNDVDSEGVPRWSLPLPGQPGSDETRKVAGMCAICLGVYACGDQVVWSSNPKCHHAYHEDCVLSWLVRRRKQCPCCRQSFLSKK